MSNNRPDWLDDDGEFKEPIGSTAKQPVTQKSKTTQHSEADAAAFKLSIIFILGFLCLLIFFGLISSSTSRSTSTNRNHIQAAQQCNMTSQQFQYGIQYARTPEELNDIVGYYYTYCRSD